MVSSTGFCVRPFCFAILALLIAGRSVHSITSSSPVELLQNAVDAYFEERYDDSIRFYNAILEIDPGNAAAKKGVKTAGKRREEQVRKQRAAERPNFDAVTAYLSQGRLVEASDRVRDIATRLPGHPDVVELSQRLGVKAKKALAGTRAESSERYYQEGVTAYLQEDWFKAVASWERVLKFDAGRVDVKAKIERARKNLGEQERLDRIQVLLDVGQEMVRQRLFAEAIKACSDVIALDQKNVGARDCLDKARRGALEEAVRARSEEVQRLLEKAMGLFTSQRTKESAKVFQQVLAKDPDNRVAVDYLTRIAGRDPSFQVTEPGAMSKGGGNLQRGMQYLDAGQYDEAIAAFERYLALQPDDLRAQEALEEARGKQSEATETAYREGLSLWAQGDLPAAKASWENALRIDPNNMKAKQALVKSKQEESRN